MAESFTWLLESVDRMVSAGSVVALALICVLQYAAYVHRRAKLRRQNELLRSQMDGLETELVDVQKDRSLARLENQILREFVSETEVNRELGLLLKRFVPNTSEGFGALVRLGTSSMLVEQYRGLEAESQAELRIDAAFLNRLAIQRVLVVDAAELSRSELLRSMANKDRGKARQLFLIAVGAADNPAGVLVTTSLYPAGAPVEQQLELAQRLMQSIAGDLRQFETLEMQELRLRSANDILEMQSIVNRHYDTPLAMVEAFINELRVKLQADRAVLYLLSSELPPTRRVLVRCGTAMQAVVLEQWNNYEDLLTDATLKQGDLSIWRRPELEAVGVNSLMGSSLAAPLIRQSRPIGAVCFSRQQDKPMNPTQRELATWGVHYLSETLLRVLNHAVVERQARQDALTEMANRRVFDLQFEQDLRWARETGNECSLVLCDLDHFKSINDRFGHPMGDEVLRRTARILQDRLLEIRSGDRALAARYGGEEFALLLPGMGISGATRIAEAVRAVVATTTIRFQTSEVRPTLSAGVATYPKHGSNAVELIAAADAALYQAKDAGRNRVASPAEVHA